jgi:hypothetical protein
MMNFEDGRRPEVLVAPNGFQTNRELTEVSVWMR